MHLQTDDDDVEDELLNECVLKPNIKYLIKCIYYR